MAQRRIAAHSHVSLLNQLQPIYTLERSWATGTTSSPFSTADSLMAVTNLNRVILMSHSLRGEDTLASLPTAARSWAHLYHFFIHSLGEQHPA